MYSISLYNQSKAIIALLCLVFNLNYFSQTNLIPNPSFEDSIAVPTSGAELNKCSNWYSIMFTPDYFSSHSPTTPTINNVSIPKNLIGYQKPKNGNYYIGITTKFKGLITNDSSDNVFEAVQTQLPQKLIADHVYDFSMFYSLADGCGIACNQLQAYFTVNQFSFNINNSLDPNFTYPNNLSFQVENDTSDYMMDTLNWVKIQNCFIAKGSENYVSIGNFRDGILSKFQNVNRNINFDLSPTDLTKFSYYFIDDLSLYDLGYYSGKAKCKKDSSVCYNGNTIIGNNITDAATYSWSPNIALSCTNCPNPVASPTVTTKYYLTKKLCSFVTCDSITLTVFTPSASALAGLDKTICYNESTQLGANDSTKFASYSWQPSVYLSCSSCAMPLTKPLTDITYTLQKTECNINTTSTVQIKILDCETTYTIPNIFTPNNDGVNDVWGIVFNQVRDIKEYSMNIYDRWGVLMLQSNLPNFKWDGYTTSGIKCSDGVYFFVCNFNVNGEKKELKGNITLMR